jgi:flagellar secretion chaperone FliS
MSNPYGNYLEDHVLSASPLELTGMLYDATLSAVQDARLHLAQGRIAERSRAITRAVALLTELSLSLNHEAGGDLSARLAELYDYMQRRLLDANFQQRDEGLAETEQLLMPLIMAWREILRAEDTTPEPVARVVEAPAEYACHQWNA